mmetsp:Transcript_7130/g.7480  ORF Transcript_7130/g.7480 Transcript_7130/m.7480 type:complete len:1037 (-) Transcript_7130:831-3941(-)
MVSNKKVAMFKAAVEGIEVEVGLDTMSSYSLISSNLATKLGNKVALEEGEFITLEGIGGNTVSSSTYITVNVDGIGVNSFKLKCGVVKLPVDLIVGLEDIKKCGLFSVLIADTDMIISSVKEIAPEEEDEDEDNDVGVDQSFMIESMRAWKEAYPDVCSGVLSKDAAKIEPMKIELIKDTNLPIPHPPRQYSEVVNKFIASEVEKWLQDGIIVPAEVSYASQVVIVKSKGRDWRLCVDYRGLNACTKSNVFPLPNVKALLRRVVGKKFYAKIDLKKGYLQAPLVEESKDLTAFTCSLGTYKFNRVPFGLKNAPAYYQFIMSKQVLQGLIYNSCEVYLDDIIIYADTEEELHQRFQVILERLRKFNIVINPDKCCYGLKEMKFLGHIISRDGIKLSREKVQGLVDIVKPVSLSTLRSFLGLTNYFRDFIPFYAQKVAVLEELTLKKQKFVWNENHDKAFQNIKDTIVNAGMLHTLNYDLPMIVRTDASNTGVGAVLFQKDGDKILNVAFVSKKFSRAATRWSTIEQEAFGIFFALKKWEYLLQGHKFIVETDHRNLQFIQNSNEGKIGRWRLFLQDLDFEVKHIPGKENLVADALSRCHVAVVDENRKSAIEKVHSSVAGHTGISQTIKKLKALGQEWKGMRSDVVNFIKSCSYCQKSRVTTKEVMDADYCVIEAYEPFEEISIDYAIDIPVDKYGNKNILVVIDNFTKYVELFPLKTIDAISTANCLIQIFSRYGAIKRIRSDRGSQFTGELCNQLCRVTGTEQILTSGFRPQSNGIVERINAEVSKHLGILVSDKGMLQNWSDAIPLVQRILNSNVHSSTGFTPNTLLFGNYVDLNRGIFTNEESKEKVVKCHDYLRGLCETQTKLLKAAQGNLAKVLDTRISKKRDKVNGDLKVFHAGDLVLTTRRQGSKLDMKWQGPFKIIKKKFGNTYECEDLRTKKMKYFYISVMRSFSCPDGVDPIEVAGIDEDEFKVRAVVDHRLEGSNKKNKTHYYFLVKFEDGEEEWLPYMEVRELEAFEKYLQDHMGLVRELKLKI